MKKHQLIAILTALAASVACPVFGQSLSGTFDGVGTITPTGTPGVYSESFSGDGNDATYGAFTPTGTSTIDFSHPPHITTSGGQFTLAFENGTIIGTGSGTGTGNGSGTATATLDLIITGGTGFFTGATGSATVTGTLTQTSPTTVSFSSGTYTGTLTLAPEPSTLALVLPAIGALMLRRRATSRG